MAWTILLMPGEAIHAPARTISAPERRSACDAIKFRKRLDDLGDVFSAWRLYREQCCSGSSAWASMTLISQATSASNRF